MIGDTFHINGPFGLVVSKSAILKNDEFKMCVLKTQFLKPQLSVWITLI